MSEEQLHFRSGHFLRMSLAMMQDEVADSGNVLLLGPVAVVLRAEPVPHLFEKPGTGIHAV